MICKFASCVLLLALPLLAQEGRRVTGRVVDELGQPIAGATVQLRVKYGKAEGSWKTDAEGRFSLRLPAPPVGWEQEPAQIVVSAKGRMSGQKPALDTATHYFGAVNRGDLDLGDMRLAKAIPILGTIRQKGGRPLVGAQVTAIPLLSKQKTSNYWTPTFVNFSEAVSDAKGRVRLWCPQGGGLTVRVNAPGFFEVVVAHVSPMQPLDVQLQESGFVTGTLVDEQGKGLSGQVYVVYEATPAVYTNPFMLLTGSSVSGLVKSGDDGRFKFSIDHPGRFRFRVLPKAGVLQNVYHAKPSRVFSGPTENYRLVLSKKDSKTFVVKATDPDGKAIGGFRAAAAWQDADSLSLEFLEMMFGNARKADASGQLQLSGPVMEQQPRTGKVLIKADGFAPFLSKKLTWDDDKPPQVAAKMVKESVLEGVVVEAKGGKPIAGAVVSAALTSKESGVVDFGAMHQGPTAKTDAKGRFRIAMLGKGKYRVRVTHRTHSDATIKKIDLAQATAKSDLEIQMTAGFALTCSFKGSVPNGLPSGLAVKLTRGNDDLGMGLGRGLLLAESFNRPDETWTTTLDAKGAFSFESLPKGTYQLSILLRAVDGAEGPWQKQVREVRIKKRDLKLKPINIERHLPARVRGRVKFGKFGLPMDRVLVVVEDESKGLMPFGFGSSSMGRAVQPKPDGTYEVLATAGAVKVAVLDAATGVVLARETTSELGAGKAGKLDFGIELGRIKVTLETANGVPIPSNLLSVLSAEEEADALGRVVFDGGAGGATGVPLAPGQREVVLLLPTKELKLILRNVAAMLGSDMEVKPAVLGQLEILPKANKTTKVTLKVGPAPEIDKEK